MGEKPRTFEKFDGRSRIRGFENSFLIWSTEERENPFKGGMSYSIFISEITAFALISIYIRDPSRISSLP